ncbi:hypothetical protein K461DRAFT_284876 [Myriangium duriaei CBS 260.36]|uniref:Uncharacterized protein n=1 Tax=Myriangium duriaei CBS 260.36 TaxID=1168546 RepID=A0A9P4MRC8_9PEZI|nr:hypothetical protein K461DRAFT_284876 [Myriangium duriaei CBS 260.36]
MHINSLPSEVLHQILKEAATLNKQQGVAWTFGLSHGNVNGQPNKVTRSIRGPVSTDTLRWDSTSSIRQVCKNWHDWALRHALRDIYLRRWRGSERWAELPIQRSNYAIYELIGNPSGCAVYRDPYGSLRETLKLFTKYPELTDNVERLWFNSFLTPESEALIFKVLRSCRFLSNISVPWTMLRHGSGQDWMHLLGIANEEDLPVQSLELQAVCIPQMMAYSPDMAFDRKPLLDPRVDFSNLKRLKLIGNTNFMPVCDEDLRVVARTACNLEEFHVTCLSTVSIAGVMAVVKGAQQTLRVLDHSPRSDDGFFHPDPGHLDDGDHACDILANCPQLKDLSISIPSVCSHLFANHDVKWEGDLQVRALQLCPTHTPTPTASSLKGSRENAVHLKELLDEARILTKARERQRKHLDVELFFADCIFDPADENVHGGFALAEISSYGHWPSWKTPSGKGPYGSTGLYGKDEGDWDMITEGEWFRGIDGGYLRV